MRSLPPILAVSTAMHAALIGLAVRGAGDPRPSRPARQPPRVELVDVEPSAAPPIDITLLDLDRRPPPLTIATLHADPDRDARSTTVTDESAALVASSERHDPESGPITAPGQRNRWLDMRRNRIDIRLPRARWDDLEHVPAGTTAQQPVDVTTGELAPAGGGTYRSDQGVFTARIDRDGGVTLKDKRNFNIRFALPGKKAIGNAISSWYRDPNKPTGTIQVGEVERPVVLQRDESSGADKKPDHGKTVPIVSGGFDVTDALMRHKGMDPYASKKLAFLDSTRDERVQIGTKHKLDQLARAGELMQRNLDRLWTTVADPAARRRGLFELWDDCAETGSAALVTAGRDARRLVVGYIRARLPAGSAAGYTDAELAALNRTRRSRATFAPYGDAFNLGN